MKKDVSKILKGVNPELKNLLESNIDGMVESHVEGWKDRYYRKSVKDIKFDLYVNHDPSIEIEYVENELNRELTDEENQIVVEYFNESVLNEFR